jgi:hypothetical protein
MQNSYGGDGEEEELRPSWWTATSWLRTARTWWAAPQAGRRCVAASQGRLFQLRESLRTRGIARHTGHRAKKITIRSGVRARKSPQWRRGFSKLINLPSWYRELLERGFHAFSKIQRIASWYWELLEML